jgi:hypothetical protein
MPSLARCCGCQTGRVSEPNEPQDNILDLAVLEANERSIKFCFRAPRKAAKLPSSSNQLIRLSNGPLEFVVSVLGGPYSDIHGPREEQIQNVECGSSVVHEVLNLQPETEYTINVGLVSRGGSLTLLEETLEARTANATTALFAEEDWGRSNAKGLKGDKDNGKDPKAPEKEGKEASKQIGGSTSSWMNSPGASSSSSAAPATSASAAAQADTQDDVSTNAPSEAGDEDAARNDNASDSGSEPDATTREGGSRRASQASVENLVVEAPVEEAMEEVVTAVEVEGPPKRTLECKFFDCFKLGFRGNRPPTTADDIVVQRGRDIAAEVAAPKAAPKRRVFKPYRPPFPGIPVDPASVGLLPRVDLEVM